MPERDLVLPLAAEDVLGVVQLRAGEPLRAGHRALGEHPLVRLRRLHLEEVPDRGPEVVELFDRPAPQRVVVVRVDVDAAIVVQPARVARERRVLAALVGGLPQRLQSCTAWPLTAMPPLAGISTSR